MTDIKTHIPSVHDDYVLLCEFPTHIVEMYADNIDRLKKLIEYNKNNPIYKYVNTYEIRNKQNETIYSSSE